VVGVENADLNILDGCSDRSGFVAPDVVVRRVWGRLGQAVTLGNGAAVRLPPAVRDFNRQRGRGREEVAHGRQAPRVHVAIERGREGRTAGSALIASPALLGSTPRPYETASEGARR